MGEDGWEDDCCCSVVVTSSIIVESVRMASSSSWGMEKWRALLVASARAARCRSNASVRRRSWYPMGRDFGFARFLSAIVLLNQVQGVSDSIIGYITIVITSFQTPYIQL